MTKRLSLLDDDGNHENKIPQPIEQHDIKKRKKRENNNRSSITLALDKDVLEIIREEAE